MMLSGKNDFELIVVVLSVEVDAVSSANRVEPNLVI